MSYQVIARKYRPQRFADVVGQEHVTQTLANAIAQNRIAHAYLFCGPRGTGKTTIARIFAKCLNCTGGPKADFDENDPRCIEITEGRALDVLEIDGASNNGVEQVRELRETCRYAPASSKFKIYIIDEVHMLSPAAFNALLKTLEEPPEHVKFMFATTEPEKVLPTILSRCQRFDLRRIPSALIVKHLADIAKKEKVQIDQSALYAIARGADGGMRDAESTLDQLISFCGEKIEEADVLSMFGLTSQSQIIALSRAVLGGDAETALRELNELARHGKDLARLLSDLLGHSRNLLIHQISRGDMSMLEVSEAEAASLAEQAPGTDTDSLTRIMEVFTECEGRLRDAASKKIFVEVALLRAIEAREAVNLDAVLKQLHQMRKDAGQSGASAPVGNTSAQSAAAMLRETPAKPAPTRPAMQAAEVPNQDQVAGEASLPTSRLASTLAPPEAGASTDLESLWQRLIEAAGRASPFLRSYLLEAHPVSFDKGVFTIGFDPEFAEHVGLVDNARNHTLLQTKLHELGHNGVQVKFIKAERPIGGAAKSIELTPALSPQSKKAAPATMSKEEFKNDPLIKKALEIFKGQIVDVRA